MFAYTIKAWSLPTEGHPANHSALLSVEQWEELAAELGADSADPWAPFAPGTPEAELCELAARRLERETPPPRTAPAPPRDVGRAHIGETSTQQSFGRFFVDLRHAAPEVVEHVVTVSPDVASSTNLGGWINHAGVWNLGDRIDWFADDRDTLVRWRESAHGQHIELGIAEGNLVGLLGELGATWSRDGQPLLPIGTIYDPFVNRALEPWSFGIYAGGQSILVGHAVRGHAGAGGRRAPVDHHALGRHRAAALRLLGARLRPGPRVDPPARPRPPRPPGRRLGLLPPQHEADRPVPRRRPGGR